MGDKVHKSFLTNISRDHPMAFSVCLCCSAAFMAETVTYPLDMLKTRLQVYGELKKHQNPGVFRLGFAVIRHEGILQLWQGLSPALYRHLIYTSSRVPIYESIRQHVFHLPPAGVLAKKSTGCKPDKSGVTVASTKMAPAEATPTVALKAAAAGVVAGGVAQFMASPTDLLKVRLQTERRWMSEHLIVGSSPASHASQSVLSHASKSTGLVNAVRQLVKEGGVIGLWRGWLPNVQRAALVNMGELATYDTTKRWIAVRFQLEDGPLLHLCSSIMSGFVAATLGTPVDLIKTRVMNQRLSPETGNKLLYSGMVDCAQKIIRTEGFMALYKGFFLIWARMAPWSLTFWLTYEELRIATGVGGF